MTTSRLLRAALLAAATCLVPLSAVRASDPGDTTTSSAPISAAISGTIESIDVMAETVTVRTLSNEIRTVAYDAKTDITINGRPARPEDLERGQMAVITTATREGKEVAATIAASPAAPRG